MKNIILLRAYLSITLLCGCLFVSAQATRTWVSGVGDDANPCSRTAPCKTLAGAISKTASGGEINALDAAGVGAVTITKSMTIDGAGTFTSILSSMTNGIIINAGPDAVVTLRHLSINGAGNGISGIKIIAAKKVFIEYCNIANFTQKGIEINATTPCVVSLSNDIIENADDAVFANGTGISVIAENCSFRGSSNGVNASAGVSVVLSKNMISDNQTALQGKGNFMSTGNNVFAGNKAQGASLGMLKTQ